MAHPKAGASFETFCIEQILLHARLADPGAEGFFFRTHTGVEVDLLLRLRGRLIPIEIKLGTALPDVRSLELCRGALSLPRGFVVSARSGKREVRPSIWQVGLADLLEDLRLAPAGLAAS
jgi:hypothetical protein